MADEAALWADPSKWSREGAAASNDATGMAETAGEQPPTPDGDPGDSPGARNAAPGLRASDAHLCPWCSADLGSANPDRCPSCGAALVEAPEIEEAVPGVTAVDPEAVRRAATWERVRKRSGLRTLLDTDRDGLMDSGVQPSSLAALAPPSAEVREEMARLRAELDAAAEREAQELAALQAAASEGLDDAAAPPTPGGPATEGGQPG